MIEDPKHIQPALNPESRFLATDSFSENEQIVSKVLHAILKTNCGLVLGSEEERISLIKNIANTAFPKRQNKLFYWSFDVVSPKFNCKSKFFNSEIIDNISEKELQITKVLWGLYKNNLLNFSPFLEKEKEKDRILFIEKILTDKQS